MDVKVMLLYFIKFLRILFNYISLFLTTRVYSPIYEEAVYDKKTLPPKLWKYLLIFLAFDISFNCFLVVLLFLIKMILNMKGISTIDTELFMWYAVDYILANGFVFAMAALISLVITNKKYFHYKYEGLRAIRAFQGIVFRLLIVMNLFPFYLLI